MKWFAWGRKRRRSKTSQASPKPKSRPAEQPRVSDRKEPEGLQATVAAGDEGAQGEATCPVSVSQVNAGSAPGPDHERDGNWFTESEVAALAQTKSAEDLSARIATRMPDCCREEQLFRYQLSRAVFLEDFELPVLPQSATGVMALARNPRASASDYVKLIEPDASLTREVFATTNSSLYGGRQPIVALPQAVARLGIREIERVALVHTMRSKLFRVSGFEELLTALIEHNLVTSCVAQSLAHDTDAKVEDACLAGLFHDVGKLVLLSIVGQVQHKLRWKASESLVQSTFDAFHVRVGELACSRWEFPDEIVGAVGAHHDAEAASATPLASVVYTANRVVNVLAHGAASTEEVSTLDALAEESVVFQTLGGSKRAAKNLEDLRRIYHERRHTLEPA